MNNKLKCFFLYKASTKIKEKKNPFETRTVLGWRKNRDDLNTI